MRSREGHEKTKKKIVAAAGEVRRDLLERFWGGFGKVLGRFWEGLGKVLGRSWEGLGKVLGRSWEGLGKVLGLSRIHISEPTRRTRISYAVCC